MELECPQLDGVVLSKRAFAGCVLWYLHIRRGTLPLQRLRDHVVRVSPWRAEIEPDALERNTFEQACWRRHVVLQAAIGAAGIPAVIPPNAGCRSCFSASS